MSTEELVRTDHGLRRGRLGLPDVIAQSVAVVAPAVCGGVVSYIPVLVLALIGSGVVLGAGLRATRRTTWDAMGRVFQG